MDGDGESEVNGPVEMTIPAGRPTVRGDPWGEAVADFLADLLDNVEVRVITDEASDHTTGPDDRIPAVPVEGADGRARQFGLIGAPRLGEVGSIVGGVPAELADLPDAALRALARVTRSTAETNVLYPSLARALHDAVIAEVLADRLVQRIGPGASLDPTVQLLANTLDYFGQLAATRYEGQPVTHGVVIATDHRGLRVVDPPVEYPGILPTRKRTPLLFDGTESVLVITASGHVLSSFERDAIPGEDSGIPIGFFDELPGLDGALTAAASASFRGVGAYLRPDQSIWIFDDGAPLFIRRTSQWKSIALEAFASALALWGRTTAREIAERVARAALRLSIRGQGAVLAIAPDSSSIAEVVEPSREHRPAGPASFDQEVDDELARLVARSDLRSSGGMARLARIDGATIVDPGGELLAYGAIVHSFESGGEGARTAAARALSMRTNLAVAVSQDGPVTVFVDGEIALEIL
jgi:hypothetical protein